MAKNKVKIDVSVDDKGSTRKVGVGAKKAADGLDKAGTSAHSTDRRLKGASQQSSNTTKNFSKMAQGISGGLVPAYATLASTLFAVSAAFNFLKQAGQLATLQAGQVAYASATGTGLRTLANEISSATDSMITFKDASEAAAIGTAAGLSPEQLTRLGKAAKDTSIILGRDVTDSFNRLVRGVTKAEPELLDELGIILRLDDASEKYKQTMGILGRELTTFEKSQAVANDVLEQSEEKYGRILEILEVQPNIYAQLGKAFDDIVNKIKGLADKALKPLARVLTETPELAIAAFGLFAASIMQSIIPGLSDIGSTSKVAFANAIEGATAATSSLRAYNNALMAGRGDKKAAAALGQGAGAGMQQTLRATGQKFRGSYKQAMADPTKLSKRQIQVMIKDYEKGTGQIMMLSKKQRTALIRDLKDLELANKITQGKIASDAKVAQNSIIIGFRRVHAAGVIAFSGLKVAAAGFGRALGMLMGAFGWISLLITAGMMIKDYIENNKELTIEQRQALADEKERAEAIASLTSKFKSLNEELSKMPEVLAEITKEGKTSTFPAVMNMLGGAVQNLSEENITKGISSLGAGMQQTAALEQTLKEAQNRVARLQGIIDSETSTYRERETAGLELRGSRSTEYGDFRGKGALDALKSAQSAVDSQEGLTDLDVETKEFLENRLKSLKSINPKILAEDSRLAQERVALEQFLTTGVQGELVERMEATKAFTANVSKPYVKQTQENAKMSQSLLQQFLPPSKYDSMVNALKTESELLTKLKADNEKLDPDGKKEQSLSRQITMFKELADMERRHKKEQLALTVATQNLDLKATPLQAQHLALQIKELQATQKIAHLQDTIDRTKTIVVDGKKKELDITKDLTAQEQHTLSLNQLQLEAEQGKLERIQAQLDTQHQLNQAFKAGFEGATTKGINDLITGKESSFGDVALGSVRGGLEGMAGQLSKQMSRGVSDTLFGAVGIDREKTADEVLQGVYDSSNNALRVTMSADPTDTSGTRTSLNPEDPQDSLVNEIKEGSKSFAEDFKAVWTEKGPSFTEKLKSTFDLGSDTLGDVFSSFSTGFKDIMGSIGAGLKSLFGFRSGGYTSILQARHGAMPRYNTGGIARGRDAGYPAILHGNEAVVPLPDGKTIPVEMKGGSGGIVNNVTVNISKEGQASVSQNMSIGGAAEESKGKELGKLITMAIQEELVKQQRPGGLLSPIGV